MMPKIEIETLNGHVRFVTIGEQSYGSAQLNTAILELLMHACGALARIETRVTRLEQRAAGDDMLRRQGGA